MEQSEQRLPTISTNSHLVIPELCETHAVPYAILTEAAIAEEEYGLLDPASISATLSKKYRVPHGRIWARVSMSTRGNRICGTVNHRDCVDLEPLEIGGYLLLSYCGLGVDIMVFVPKNNFTGKWDDFI